MEADRGVARSVAVNQRTNTISVTDTGSRSVSVIAGAK